MNATTANFTATQRTGIEALCASLATKIGHSVVTAYDSTDEGQHWAALCVETLDAGAFGRSGPLVSIVTGAGVDGEAAAMAADGSAINGGAGFPEVLQTAQGAAMQAWAAMND